MSVEPIPDDYPQVIPYLTVDDAAQRSRSTRRARREGADADGRPRRQDRAREIDIGRGCVMLSDEFPDMGGKTPRTVGGTPVTVMTYVADVDATFRRALDRGAREVRPIENQFYGDRSGQFEDPFGHLWYVATHIEDLSEEEMMQRAASMGDPGS
jgi:PhnB protein